MWSVSVIGAASGVTSTRSASFAASYCVSHQSFVSVLKTTVHSSFPGIVTSE